MNESVSQVEFLKLILGSGIKVNACFMKGIKKVCTKADNLKVLFVDIFNAVSSKNLFFYTKRKKVKFVILYWLTFASLFTSRLFPHTLSLCICLIHLILFMPHFLLLIGNQRNNFIIRCDDDDDELGEKEREKLINFERIERHFRWWGEKFFFFKFAIKNFEVKDINWMIFSWHNCNFFCELLTNFNVDLKLVPGSDRPKVYSSHFWNSN